MAIRTISISASDDMDRVDPTTSGSIVTDVRVLYDNSLEISKVLTALENAKNVILKDLS